MAGGVTSPPICRAALSIVVPGSTSTVILSMVTLNNFFSVSLTLYYFFYELIHELLILLPPLTDLHNAANP